MTKQHTARWVNIDAIQAWDKNPRNNEHAVQSVADSIERFGWGSPIIARKSDGVVIAGHTRLKAAQRLKMDKVLVRYLDLDPAEAAALALADNKIGELADWDDEGLRAVLLELDAEDVNLDGLGFTDEELDAMLMAEDHVIDPELEPVIQPSQGEPDSTAGSVYHLGPHVLVCGDCTSAESWQALDINGDCSLFTSPPYNLTSSALSGNRALSERGCAYLEDESPWLPLMNGWMANAVDNCDVIVCNVQLLAGNKRDLFGWVDRWSEHLADVAIWDKQTSPPQMAANVLNCEWEFMFIFGSKGATRSIKTADFHGNQPNIYRAPPQRRNEFAQLHGATFPVHLPAWAFETILQLADVVIDPFGGTGTTMIAAAQANKSARLIELNPHYCDIIRRRWTAYARANNIDPGPGALDPLDGE